MKNDTLLGQLDLLRDTIRSFMVNLEDSGEEDAYFDAKQMLSCLEDVEWDLIQGGEHKNG